MYIKCLDFHEKNEVITQIKISYGQMIVLYWNGPIFYLGVKDVKGNIHVHDSLLDPHDNCSHEE